MKKTLSILAGLITGLIAVIYLAEIFQFIVSMFFTKGSYIMFSGFSITSEINTAGLSIASIVIISIAPLIFCMIMIELSNYLVSKTDSDSFRIAGIVFNLINTGYIIFSIILGIISIALRRALRSDWYYLLEQTSLSHAEKLFMMFFVLLMLFAYLNFSSKRMRKNIPVINKSK